MKQPTLLIAILNYCTPELTLKSAEAALKDSHGLNSEIVIVDNDSGDDSFDLILATVREQGWDADGRVRVLQSGHNGGFGAGNNVAIRAGLSDGSQPDFVYLLNSDAWPKPGAIRALLDFMSANPGAGLAGSAIEGVDGTPHQTAFRFPTIRGEFEGAARTGIFSRLFADHIVALPCFSQATQVDWVAGAGLMMRRTMLDEIGLFDETFFLYFEETDLCQRAARANWRCWYVPASQVVHIGSVSTGMKAWRRTPPYWFDSRLHYFTKTHGRVYWVGATLARIAGGSIWRLRRLFNTRPLGDPPAFLRDLTAHGARHLFRARPAAADFTRPVLEDRK